MNGRRLSQLAGLLLASLAVASFALAQSVPSYGPSPTPSMLEASRTTVTALSTITAPAVFAPSAASEWNRTLLAIVRTDAPGPLRPATKS